MALKFRRGTTAQQSGSLAFGEPFVNTTLGTLLVGGPNGDIVLSSAGTGSTGNFGAISGSGLDITGNANIAGNLTLGGAITIGDASADTINVIASVSSSIIPSVTNAFDLGSEDFFWRDIYVSTGSIKFVGAAGNIVGTLTNIGNGLNLDAGIVTKGNSSFGTSSLAVTSVTGSLRVSGSLNVIGGINGVINATNGVVSGSSQVIAILDSLNTFSGSSLTRFTEIGVVSGSLITSASAAAVANTNLNTFSGSVLTRLTEIGVVSGSLITSASAAKTTNDSQDVSITNLNSTTASLNTSVTNINSTTASLNTSVTNINSTTASLNTSVSNLNTTTSSLNTSVTNLNTYTSSLKTALSLSGADLTVLGNLTVQGDTTTLNTANLLVEDKLIEIATGTTSSAAANGAGIFISGANASILWDDAASTLDINKAIDIAGNITLTGNVDGVDVSVFNSNVNSTTASLNTSVSNLNSFSSSQLTQNSNLATHTGSVNTRFTEIGVVSGSLISSASVAKTTNDSQGVSITNLNTTTASLLIETANLESFSSSALTRLSALETSTGSLNTFTSSANTRLGLLETSTGSLNTFTSSINTTIKDKLNTDGVVSGSGQINVASTTGDIALGTRTSGNYVASLVAGTNITLSNNSGEGATPTIGLTNNTISGIALGSNLSTLTIGTGLSGTSYNGSSAVTIANTGVTSNVAGTGVSVSGATGAVTISIGQAVATSSNVQFNSLGVGMAASATAGRIDATNDIVAFSSSDIRFKENIKPIENAIDKIRKISGNTYDWKEENKIEHGYEGNDVGVIAQEIEAVLPQLVQTRESGFKAVKYDKLVALLIEGIKEQQLQIEQLRIDLNNCRNNKGL